jgi:hypothetical protein
MYCGYRKVVVFQINPSSLPSLRGGRADCLSHIDIHSRYGRLTWYEDDCSDVYSCTKTIAKPCPKFNADNANALPYFITPFSGVSFKTLIMKNQKGSSILISFVPLPPSTAAAVPIAAACRVPFCSAFSSPIMTPRPEKASHSARELNSCRL